MTAAPTISERVRELRHALRLAQAGFAEMIGVHSMTVSKWERGTDAPPLAEMVRIVLLERGCVALFGARERDTWRDEALVDLDRKLYAQLVLECRLVEAGALVIVAGIEL